MCVLVLGLHAVSAPVAGCTLHFGAVHFLHHWLPADVKIDLAACIAE